MIGLIIFTFIVGAFFAVVGGRIMFSDKALDQMYEKGWWKKNQNYLMKKTRDGFIDIMEGGAIHFRSYVFISINYVAYFFIFRIIRIK